MVLWMSNGELLLVIGATAALIGPKDLPRIARLAGRLMGRSIAYVQLARGQFDSVMQNSPAGQMRKEVQELRQQVNAVFHELHNASTLNPGPLTRGVMGRLPDIAANDDNGVPENRKENQPPKPLVSKDFSFNSSTSSSTNSYTQAVAYAKIVESGALESGAGAEMHNGEADSFTIIPISAESTGFLPNRKESPTGSDLVLEAIIEAEVARNGKDLYAKFQNQIPRER